MTMDICNEYAYGNNQCTVRIIFNQFNLLGAID